MKITTAAQYLFKSLLALASIALICMMLVISANVVGRLFFSMPLMGALEIAGLAGVVLVGVSMSYTEKEERNVSVEVLFTLFPPRVRSAVYSFSLLLSFVAVVFLAWAVCHDAYNATRYQERTMVLEIMEAPFKIAWGAGTVMLCFFLLKNMASSFKKVFEK